MVFKGRLIKIDKKVSYSDGPFEFTFEIGKMYKGDFSGNKIKVYLDARARYSNSYWNPSVDGIGKEMIVFLNTDATTSVQSGDKEIIYLARKRPSNSVSKSSFFEFISVENGLKKLTGK